MVEAGVALAAPVIVIWAWRRGWLRSANLAGRWLSPLPWAGLLFAALALYLLSGLVGLLMGVVATALLPADAFAAKSLASMATFTLAVGAAVLTLSLVAPASAAPRGNAPPGSTPTAADPLGAFRLRPRHLPRGVLCFLLAAPVVVAVSLLAVLAARLVTGAAPEPVAHDLLRQILDHRASPWAWGLVAAAVLGAPVVEEIAYRALFQSAILEATGRPWIAIVITSILFAAAHLSPGAGVPVHALATLAALSVCMGVAYERTRSLIVPISMHVCFNAANVLLALLTR
ncbi:MAG: lysostaphin resistance A-like protein [Phycisphaerales bacterium]